MEKKFTGKSILKNSIIFIALIAVTFFILFKDNNISDILAEVRKAKKIYILIGIACTFIYVACEAVNLHTILKSFSYKIKFISVLKYPFIGFFFSSITPSASGGQPMQIYYMAKDNIEVSHGSLAIFLEFAAFQIVTITLAIVSFALNYRMITGMPKIIIFLIVSGIMFNSLILIFMLCVIFSKRFTKKIAGFIFWIGKKIKFLKIEHLREKIEVQINEYQKGAVFIRGHKAIMAKITFMTLLQVCSLYSISFWIYRALGFSQATLIQMLELQSILYIAVSGIPLPGAVGASESTFMKIFRGVYSAEIISSAVLLSRGISFYLFVLVSGCIVAGTQIFTGKKKMRDDGGICKLS